MVKETLSRGAWRGLADLRPDVARILARSCRDSSDLDDLVQETLLRAARFRESLQEVTHLRPWVLRIAWNVMRDHARNVGRRRQVEVAEEFFHEVEGREAPPGELRPPEELAFGNRVFESDSLLDLLGGAVNALDPIERGLLNSFYVEERTCAEAGRRLEVNTHTVKMRLFRIRRRLRRALARQVALLCRPRIADCERVA